MKKPTIEEVREHFKDAKVIRSKDRDFYIKISEYNLDHILYDDMDLSFNVIHYPSEESIIIWDYKHGYAEIVEYKDEYYKKQVTERLETIQESWAISDTNNNKQMEPKQDGTEFHLSFETVGGVDVILTGKSLDNLVTIANMIK